MTFWSIRFKRSRKAWRSVLSLLHTQYVQYVLYVLYVAGSNFPSRSNVLPVFKDDYGDNIFYWGKSSSSIFPWSSEAFALNFLEKLVDVFPHYYIHSIVCNWFKSLINRALIFYSYSKSSINAFSLLGEE